ncbi:MAG: protein-L-isoaspartate(D-aspartate) O-methyltransferase [Bacteroidia bacterium]|nr:protein-L-isoaspartate(D-aspartate) O-methyltransferase [Bacteroidia bacterium]MCZ2248322.1 protein-L-isoaspartate(D-aspartate) O-methyltransferase [Bacteroidia bacterium]
MQIKDSFKHKGRRLQMVEMLKEMGIVNGNVLAVMAQIPRHAFLDEAFFEFAYENRAFQIGEGQTISQPYTVAFQTQLLNVVKNEKILEIGTGSGYQTSVLCGLGAKVFSIERQKYLYEKTKKFLPLLNINPKLFYGDGYLGLPPFAPFDKILVTAGAPYVPEPLKHQLKVGGTMVIPVGDNKGQKMYSITKIDENNFESQLHGDFQFVPLLEQKH